MIVAGGTYVERCVAPRSEEMMGSGGRATLALPRSIGAQLHTFHPDAEDVRANFGNASVVHSIDDVLSFEYLHPLASPRISPVPLPRAGTVDVAGDRVIRFGCLEGDFRLDAGVAVYDPQNGYRSERFRANGSRADRLALVLNAHEVDGLAGGVRDREDAAASLLEAEAAEVVVLKLGPAGALVLRDGARAVVPAYRTTRVSKIGSGDVFTAMFALHWAIEGMDAVIAADMASRQTAAYVADRVLPCPAVPEPAEPVFTRPFGDFVLAVDGDDIAAEWLATEARRALLAIGARRVIASSQTTPGTEPTSAMFAAPREAGGAALAAAIEAFAKGIPTIVFAERDEVATAARAAGLSCIDDFAGAIYATAWCAA